MMEGAQGVSEDRLSPWGLARLGVDVISPTLPMSAVCGAEHACEAKALYLLLRACDSLGCWKV